MRYIGVGIYFDTGCKFLSFVLPVVIIQGSLWSAGMVVGVSELPIQHAEAVASGNNIIQEGAGSIRIHE